MTIIPMRSFIRLDGQRNDIMQLIKIHDLMFIPIILIYVNLNLGLQKFGLEKVLRCEQSMLISGPAQCLRGNLLQFGSGAILTGLFTKVTTPGVLSEAKHELDILQLRNPMGVKCFPRR